MFGGKAIETALNGHDSLFPLDLFRRRVARIHECIQQLIDLSTRALTEFGERNGRHFSRTVSGQVEENSTQPGKEVATMMKLTQAFPGREKCFLSEILCLRPV